jgi:hypothetical protein
VRISSRNEVAITASCSGFGTPFRFVFPSRARRDTGLEERLGSHGRPRLPSRPRRHVAGIPHRLWRRRGHVEGVAAVQLPPLALDFRLHGPLEDLEALLLARMGMHGAAIERGS